MIEQQPPRCYLELRRVPDVYPMAVHRSHEYGVKSAFLCLRRGQISPPRVWEWKGIGASLPQDV